MKTKKVIYWISTGLITMLMLFSTSAYLFGYEDTAGRFTNMGYPTYIIYPLALAKILGLIAIIARKVDVLAEWAYAGFFFNLILACAAHYYIDDSFAVPLAGLVFLLASYILGKEVRSIKNESSVIAEKN